MWAYNRTVCSTAARLPTEQKEKVPEIWGNLPAHMWLDHAILLPTTHINVLTRPVHSPATAPRGETRKE
eukprot:6117287-Prymnesium_polylepis.1